MISREGSSRPPKQATITMVPRTSGPPVSANSKNPNGRPVASAAASLMMMFTGVPVSASIDPPWAAKASGMSSWLGASPARTATTTTTGISAATAPLMLISAESTATSRLITTISGARLRSPGRRPAARPRR